MTGSVLNRKRPTLPPGGVFATTHWSVVLAVKENDSIRAREALETLCRVYWEPVYAFLRRSGQDHHSAKDLTQSFFLHLLERDDFARVEREKGRFRSFLLVSLKHFLINARLKAGAQKRGGGQSSLSLDEAFAEGTRWSEPADHITPEKLFDRRWAVALFERVLVRLRQEYAAAERERQFEFFKSYLSDEGEDRSQAEIARELGMAPGSIKVAIHRMRRRYREMLREEVARTVATEAEISDELRALIASLRS